MKFPDYTKIEWFKSEYAICPNCGKLLRAIHHDNAPDLYDCDSCYLSWDTWYTCKCKDCKVSGDGSDGKDFSLEDQAAWKFPKDYEITATQKQNNYIRFLANEVGVYFNYISNKEVAGELINQLLSLYTKKQQKEIDTGRRASLFRSLGYTPNGEDDFVKSFGESNIRVQIQCAKDDKLKFSIWSRDYTAGQETEDLLLAINSVKADLKTLEYRLPKINKATPEEAAKKIEDNKVAFKKHCEHDNIDIIDESYFDYDDEAPDFGDLC